MEDGTSPGLVGPMDQIPSYQKRPKSWSGKLHPKFALMKTSCHCTWRDGKIQHPVPISLPISKLGKTDQVVKFATLT